MEKPVRAVCSAVFAIFLLGLPPAAAEPAVVLCHDAARDLVQQTLAGECRGEIVSEEEAAQIRERQRLDRARTLRRTDPPAPSPAGPRRRAFVRFGTAFPVDHAGHYLTAAHVATGCESLEIEGETGATHAARLVGADPVHDMALLHSELVRAPVPVSASSPRTGMTVRVVGFPEEGLPRIRPLETRGRVAAVGADAERRPVLAFSAPVRRGNSGGPLLTEDGRLLGVVVAKIDTPALFAETGRTVRDLAFAPGTEMIAAFLARHGVSFPPGKAMDADDPAGRAYRLVCRG